jgi:hypothetical protein
LLDLDFTTFNDYNITSPDSGIVKPDTYHPPMVIGIGLPLVNLTKNCEYTYRKDIAGDYTYYIVT